MPTLLTLRHAKSSWDDPGLTDFDRPLSKRGRNAAPAIGKYLASQRLLPDLVLCSSAARARETFERMVPSLPGEPEIRYLDRFYSGTAPDLRREIRGQAGDVETLMLIGHNPSIESLAIALIEAGDDKDMARMRDKYPTAALAVIDFDFKLWRDIDVGTGFLRNFIVPKQLKD